MDDVRLHALREAGEGRGHAEAPDERHLQQRVEILELVHDEAVELALARVDAARRDVHLVAALGEAVSPSGRSGATSRRRRRGCGATQPRCPAPVSVRTPRSA